MGICFHYVEAREERRTKITEGGLAGFRIRLDSGASLLRDFLF